MAKHRSMKSTEEVISGARRTADIPAPTRSCQVVATDPKDKSVSVPAMKFSLPGRVFNAGVNHGVENVHNEVNDNEEAAEYYHHPLHHREVPTQHTV